jgi:hypothetical protein
LAIDEFPFSSDAPAAELTRRAIDFRKATDATYAIVVGPVRTPNQSEATVPQFDVAIAYETGSDVQTHDFTGHPDILYTKAAKQAINQLRLHVQQAQCPTPRHNR